MDRKKHPIRAEDYELFEEIGQGVSACVYRARCVPFNEVVAIKVIDFEKHNADLNNISREAQTMILVDHPNVLKAHCSFVKDHNLWVVMPYMGGGSCLHILKAAYPDGFEEVVIATILREVLKGLEYLHRHGHIHRDVKAGNILIDARAGVKLGDFGVSACLFDSGDRQRTRNTFVGTPCWMAPEVLEQLNGYDFKADIWSFGITALELAHGHAPFSKYPPMKVLLMTLQNAPPSLSYEKDKKFSKSFKQMIAMCLVKDPLKRPSPQKLLKHSFFKQARSNDYIARTILEGLPPLGDRIKALKMKEEDMLAQKKMADGEKEELSQSEYKRGISGWNFNIDDMKAQAALIQDVDEKAQDKESTCVSNLLFEIEGLQEKASRSVSSIASYSSKDENDEVMLDKLVLSSPEETAHGLSKFTPFTSMKSIGSEDEFMIPVPSNQNLVYSECRSQGSSELENNLSENCEYEINEKLPDGAPVQHSHDRKASAGSITSDIVQPSSRGERVKQLSQLPSIGRRNGVIPQMTNCKPSEMTPKGSKPTVNADDPDEKSKGAVVQQKGRFKVTSENALPPLVLQKSHSMQVITQIPAGCLPSPSDAVSNSFGCSLHQHLLSILQTNVLQRDYILNLMKQVNTGDISASANRIADGAGMPTPISSNITEKSMLELAHEREKELLQETTDLQWRLVCAQEEIQRLKTRKS